MTIHWVLCNTYEEARNYSGVIYLHEWFGKPFYWGKAHRSFFGGHTRKYNGVYISGRYNSGYRHWIEGCLRNGGRLYIGILNEEAAFSIDEIENYLIYTYPTEMNRKKILPQLRILLVHDGDVPLSILNG